MRRLISTACSAAGAMALTMALAMALGGCRDNTPPPQRVPVPTQYPDDRADRTSERERDDVSRMDPASAPGPIDDRVARGNPRRYNDGDEVKPLAAPNPDEEFRPPFDDQALVSQRPPEERAFVESYRRVGRPRITLLVNRTLNDDAAVGSLDYQAIETIMTDWLASSGQITIVSPTMARQLGADVLIQVQAYPARQLSEGQEVRVIAEAMNTKDGHSIGRAVVDIPPPLDKTTINRYTRFLARKLMDDMTQTWMSPPPADRESGGASEAGRTRNPLLPARSVATPATNPTDSR